MKKIDIAAIKGVAGLTFSPELSAKRKYFFRAHNATIWWLLRFSQ
jgi:hypothetical protein